MRELVLGEVVLDLFVDAPEVDGLETLCVGTFPSNISSNWSFDLLKMNRGSLRKLHLGAESPLVRAYTQQSANLGPSLTLSHMGLSDPNNGTFSDLESLWLCNINLYHMIRTASQQSFDWSTLTSLTLDSCPRSGPGLLYLKDCKMNLKSFTVRSESFDRQTPGPDIDAFLSSFKGLESLQVLLEGFANQDLENILKTHGKTLKTLVWDERLKPRRSMVESTASGASTRYRGYTSHLQAIASHCPNLTSLGISLSWEILSPGPFHGDKVPISATVNFMR